MKVLLIILAYIAENQDMPELVNASETHDTAYLPTD